MAMKSWFFAHALGVVVLLPSLSMAGDEVIVQAAGDGPSRSAHTMLFIPAPQSSGPAGAGGGSNPAAAPTEPVAVEMPSVKGLDTVGAYWFWVALFGFAGLVCVSCFKHPKRSHNN